MDGVMALVGVPVIADVVCLRLAWSGLAAQRRERLAAARTVGEGCWR